MDARTKPYFFAFDTRTKPGTLICHCVRIETMELPSNPFTYGNTEFAVLGSDIEDDVRIRQMIECAYKFWQTNYAELNKE